MTSNLNSASIFPPSWADRILRTLVGPSDAETISGDLLEEYRASVYPSCGSWRADLWFLRQVGGFAWRATWGWALLFSALQLGREMLDWFSPPLDFKLRASITTYSAMALFVALGCWRAWRTRTFRGSVLAALVTSIISAF